MTAADVPVRHPDSSRGGRVGTRRSSSDAVGVLKAAIGAGVMYSTTEGEMAIEY